MTALGGIVSSISAPQQRALDRQIQQERIAVY